MAFTSYREITVHDVVALALVEHHNERFTASEMTTLLNWVLRAPFDRRNFIVVNNLLDVAVEMNLLQKVAGERGGAGYSLAVDTFDFELPKEVLDSIYRRAEWTLNGAKEKENQAKENAGLVFEQVVAKAWPHSRADLNIVHSFCTHWKSKGWLSSRQVKLLAEIAGRYGISVNEPLYVGAARREWIEPYLDADELLERAQTNARHAAIRADADARAANKARKAEFLKMDSQGCFMHLDALTQAVFPNLSISPSAKRDAFGGHGSRGLRSCISALAEGVAPSFIWGNTFGTTQPDDESDVWQTLRAHPKASELGLFDGETRRERATSPSE